MGSVESLWALFGVSGVSVRSLWDLPGNCARKSRAVLLKDGKERSLQGSESCKDGLRKQKTSRRRSRTGSPGALEQFKNWIKFREKKTTKPLGFVPGHQSRAAGELRAGICGKSRDLLPDFGQEEEEGAGQALLLSQLHSQS